MDRETAERFAATEEANYSHGDVRRIVSTFSRYLGLCMACNGSGQRVVIDLDDCLVCRGQGVDPQHVRWLCLRGGRRFDCEGNRDRLHAECGLIVVLPISMEDLGVPRDPAKRVDDGG